METKVMLNCDIVNDLIPLYAEKLTSETSNKAILEHFQICDECRKNAENYCKEFEENKMNTVDIKKEARFEKYLKTMRNKNLLMLICGFFIALIIGALLYMDEAFWLHSNTSITLAHNIYLAANRGMRFITFFMLFADIILLECANKYLKTSSFISKSNIKSKIPMFIHILEGISSILWIFMLIMFYYYRWGDNVFYLYEFPYIVGRILITLFIITCLSIIVMFFITHDKKVRIITSIVTFIIVLLSLTYMIQNISTKNKVIDAYNNLPAEEKCNSFLIGNKYIFNNSYNAFSVYNSNGGTLYFTEIRQHSNKYNKCFPFVIEYSYDINHNIIINDFKCLDGFE